MNLFADEIIATRNDDGTYKVVGCSFCGLEEKCEFRIPRAKIQVTAFDSIDREHSIFELIEKL